MFDSDGSGSIETSELQAVQISLPAPRPTILALSLSSPLSLSVPRSVCLSPRVRALALALSRRTFPRDVPHHLPASSLPEDS